MDTKVGNLQNGEADLGCIKEGATAGYLLHEKGRLKGIRSKRVDGFVLEENGILQKFVRLKNNVEPTTVVPRKLTSLIITEFHNGKGHQGISCMVNMIRHFFLVGLYAQRCLPTHQQLPVMYPILT